MSTDHPQQHDHIRPIISHPLTRHRSTGPAVPELSHLSSPPPRPTSPPPRGIRTKPSIFALMRRSGGTLDSIPSAGLEDEIIIGSPAKESGKGKGKGKDRWSKRASRKPPMPPPRERGESEELDWERIKTLPRVRLVPPEDEGEPVMLYPIPHPSSLIPLRARPQSPPTLLAATVAATLITTDPSTITSPPPTPPRQTSPPSGVVLNSLAHATFVSQSHGHWIGMSDKFILPPPVFSRGPTTSGRPAATRGIVMPKTRRQLEADLGKRMSMVEQRKRDSLELERFTLLPPLEEAAQSPPNVMMPPVEEGEFEAEMKQRTSKEDEDTPLALVKIRPRPTSPPPRPMYDAMMTIHSVAPFDLELITPARNEPTPTEVKALGPAFELKPISNKVSGRTYDYIDSPPSPLIVEIQAPPAHPLGLPTPPPPPSQAPVAAPQPRPTRPKRSKSLTAVLSRSSSDNEPSSSSIPPPVPQLKRQKSLKMLFFSSSEAAPPMPTGQDLPPSPRTSKRNSVDIQRDQAEASTSKKGKTSRSKSKPPLRIEVKAPPPSPSDIDSGFITPALGTASSSANSEAYPLTPATIRADSNRSFDADRVKPQSAGGIRGLSKRFSLSNMSGAFRKKGSISGMIPLPNEMEVPVVPDLPAVYKKSASAAKGKGKWKGKEKETAMAYAPMDALIERGRSESPDRSFEHVDTPINESQAHDLDDAEMDEGEESYGSPIAGPSRASSDAGYGGSIINLIGLSSLGTEPFDILDCDFEFPPSSPPHSAPSTTPQTVDKPPPVESDEITTQPVTFNPFPDPETSSISSCGSLDENDQPAIVHAQLMQVSPTTRRNPGVSLQEFLGMAPLPQTGVLVASPAEKRRSLEGVIMGSLLIAESPTQLRVEAVKDEAAVKAEKSAKRKSGSPLVIDLRGQYLKGIGPSGSRGASQLLASAMESSSPSSLRSPLSAIAKLAAAVPIEPTPSIEVHPDPEYHSKDDSPIDSDTGSEHDKEEVPVTPLDEDPHLEEPAIHTTDATDASQSSSVDSGLVIVDAPPLSPPLLPVDVSSRNTSRASTPRSRFTTPEALLRLLTSPLAASRLSRSHPTPGSNGSNKGKKNAVAPSSMPIPPGLDGLPIPRDEGGEVNWSVLLAGTQLGSLHFDDLGLDLSFGDEEIGGVQAVVA